MPTKSLGIRVPKIKGEETLALTSKLGIRDKELEIQKNTHTLHIPLTRQPSVTELAALKTRVPDFHISTRTFSERKQQAKTLAELLANKLPPDLIDKLPRALDTIGEMAIIEIPPELNEHANLIGEALLKTQNKIRTVLAKAGAVSGTYRLRALSVIAGESRTDTVHKEHGCRYHVDAAKAYFSPRLSHEHNRVASLVQDGETVVDLFAGVGPFSVLIAKGNETVKVYAVDINPDAVELLKRNIRLNRVENRVFPVLGDAQHAVENNLFGVADRVIMNLPEKAIEFVYVACNATKPTGGIVHFYGFSRLPDSIENMKVRFSKAVEKAGRKVNEFLFAKTIRETAPYEGQVVLDTEIV